MCLQCLHLNEIKICKERNCHNTIDMLRRWNIIRTRFKPSSQRCHFIHYILPVHSSWFVLSTLGGWHIKQRFQDLVRKFWPRISWCRWWRMREISCKTFWLIPERNQTIIWSSDKAYRINFQLKEPKTRKTVWLWYRLLNIIT